MDNIEMMPVHPGQILLELYLKPRKLSQSKLALGLGVPPRRVNEIIKGKRGISADSALRLARYLGTSPEVWMRLQGEFDLHVAQKEIGEIIAREVHAPLVEDMAVPA